MMTKYTKEYISQLLDKYMAGTSTLDEEDVLAAYFREDDVPREWDDYRLLFEEIEAMRPAKPKRRRAAWSVAAVAAVAAAAAVFFVAMLSQQTEQKEPTQQALTAQADTTASARPSVPAIKQTTDTTAKPEVPPLQTPKRKSRKAIPSITDDDKAYVLIAEAEQQRLQIERQIMETILQTQQVEQAIMQAQMEAWGYVAVRHEDGTIYYIKENQLDIAYEE